jgi:hypothetical protein
VVETNTDSITLKNTNKWLKPATIARAENHNQVVEKQTLTVPPLIQQLSG